MTTMAFTVRDSAAMLRRNLKRAVRYPGLTVIVAAMPIVFLLLFVFVFGGTLGAGLGAQRSQLLDERRRPVARHRLGQREVGGDHVVAHQGGSLVGGRLTATEVGEVGHGPHRRR